MMVQNREDCPHAGLFTKSRDCRPFPSVAGNRNPLASPPWVDAPALSDVDRQRQQITAWKHHTPMQGQHGICGAMPCPVSLASHRCSAAAGQHPRLLVLSWRRVVCPRSGLSPGGCLFRRERKVYFSIHDVVSSPKASNAVPALLGCNCSAPPTQPHMARVVKRLLQPIQRGAPSSK
jgi:hypothetical protein